MISMTVLYNITEDVETFEKRYIAEHIPLTKQWPGLQNGHFGRVADVMVGDAPFTHMFIGNWPDAESLQADLGSEATGPIMANASELSPGGFTGISVEWLA